MPERWFQTGGGAYAAFRPQLPEALVQAVVEQVPRPETALDVGCGSGQLTELLAPRFARVLAIDPSPSQLAHARPHPRVAYRVSPAESLPAPDQSVDLVAAAQAHWFELGRFHAEVARVARPGAVLALLCYLSPRLGHSELEDRFARFRTEEIASWWPPERAAVDSAYAQLSFPYEPLSLPAASIERIWDRDRFLGYLKTWSAWRRAERGGASDILSHFERQLTVLWPDGLDVPIEWPVSGRLGRVRARS